MNVAFLKLLQKMFCFATTPLSGGKILTENYLTGKSGSRTLSMPTKSQGNPFSFTVLDEMVRL